MEPERGGRISLVLRGSPWYSKAVTPFSRSLSRITAVSRSLVQFEDGGGPVHALAGIPFAAPGAVAVAGSWSVRAVRANASLSAAMRAARTSGGPMNAWLLV